MRHLLSLLFILGALSVFSQSEIWGVKRYGGALGGGYLYSIDSITQKIMVQHRFDNSNYLLRDLDIVSPKVHNQTASILVVADYWLIKYNELTQRTDYQFLDQKAFGSFCEVSDSLWVILKNGGIYKINPYNLNIHSISGFDIVFTTNEVGPIKYSDNELYWNQVVGAYDGAICKMNLQNEEIINVFNFDDYEDANYFPVGKLMNYNNKLYGISHKQNGSVKGFIIFSYHPGSGEYREELFIENKYIQRNNVHGFTELDGLFYSIGKIKKDEKNTYIFSYNPNNNKIDTLNILEEEISSSPRTHFLIGPENKLYCSGSEGGEFDNGSIFSYDPHSNNIEAVHHFKDDIQGPGNIAKPFTIFDDHLFYFKLSIDTNVSFNLSKLDLLSHRQKFVSDLSFLFNSSGGSFPQHIVQSSTGLIIGSTIEGGDYSQQNNGTGVIYQFDPLSHHFEVIHTFSDIDFSLNVADIYLNKNNRLFGILKSINHNNYSGKYLLDLESKEYTRLADFPWENSIVSVEMLSDSLMYAIVNNRGNEPYSLCRYNVFTDECDTVFICNENEIISNLEILNEDELLYQKVVEIDDENDESYIMKFDISHNEAELYLDLNNYSNQYGTKERFDFKVREDGRLMGSFFNNKREKDAALDYWSFRIGVFDSESQLLKILGDTARFFDADLKDYCSFKVVPGFENQNQFYGFNEVGLDVDLGEFVVAQASGDQLQLKEYFEAYSNLTAYYIYSDLELPDIHRFKKLDSDQHIWTGNNSSDWYDTENWLSNLIPDTIRTVVIPSFTPFSPQIDTMVKAKTIIIKEKAKLEVLINGSLSILEDVYNYGSFKLYACDTAVASLIHHRDFQENNYSSIEYVSDTSLNQILSVPFKTNEFQYSDYRNIYQLSDDMVDWSLIEQYPFYSHANQTYLLDQEMTALQFAGAFNFQNEQINIPPLEEKSMYPIPNPYTASLNWQDIDLSGLHKKALYRFDEADSAFVPYINGLGWESPLIQPLDMVWVYTNGYETLNFKSDDRFHAGYKELDLETPDNELIISASGKGGKDQTIISFNEMATADFDGEFDAVKSLLKQSDKPSIFTKSEDEYLSINQLPDTSMMDLFLEAGERGTYTISVDKHKDFDFLVLEDLIWNKRIDLLKQNYRFDYFTSDGHYPFKLYFSPWSLEAVSEADVLIYYYPKSIYVKSDKQIDFAQVLFYDLAGRVVLDFELKDFHYFTEPIDLVGGHYVVQFRSGDLVINRMIWILE